jgi:hypothetical protein
VKRRIRLDDAGQAVARVEAALSRRLDATLPLDGLPKLRRALARDAAIFWSQRAWSEYCAVPALSQVLLHAVDESAPLTECQAAAGILQDEALHTRLSRDVAEAFGGYEDEVPAHFGYDPKGLSNASGLGLAEWLVAGGAVGETISRALISARLPYTAPKPLKAVVLRTLKDENVHVAFTWAALERVVAPLPKPHKRRLVEVAAPTVDAAFRSLCTAGMTGAALASERKLRQRLADAGLGCAPPDVENQVVHDTLQRFVIPGLRRVGLPL